jgi:hypothetical protein
MEYARSIAMKETRALTWNTAVGAICELQQKQSSGPGWSGLLSLSAFDMPLVPVTVAAVCITDSAEASVASRSSDWHTPGKVKSIIAQRTMNPAMNLRQLTVI